MGDDQLAVLDIHQLEIISYLGRGARGVVFLARDKSSNGELFALKTILKVATSTNKHKKIDHNDSSELSEIHFEQKVLRVLQHPLLPKLRGILATKIITGYAIDYCPGRDLNYLRKKQTERMFSVDIIRFYAAELVLALEYLHNMGIAYRDLKPENIMIQENGHLMLVDFDLSTKLSPKLPSSEERSIILEKSPLLPKSNSKPPMKKRNNNRLSLFCCRHDFPIQDSVHPAESEDHISEPISTYTITSSFSKTNSFVGTEEYIAPEMLQGNGHDHMVDFWCLGIVLYEMLYGTTPFKGINRKVTFYNILSKTPELVGETTPLRDLIRKLLVKDPKERISMVQIKGHEFFLGVDWEKILDIARPPFVPGPLDENGMDVNNIDIEGFVKNVFEANVDCDVDKEKEESDGFLIF
uniref:serine/threonine-protein kinase OXI1-like n=1 Tax=Erigeron canadensis TaxID=72917 RepID=UPI001CB8F3C3|nr:serine/threonine-protein kinase OXI1-like [Erigeron canadensis]